MRKHADGMGTSQKVLRDAGYINAAIEEFETAITILDSWEWQIDLASCFAKLENYPAAIGRGTRAINTVDTVNRAAVLGDIDAWCLMLPVPDVSRAIEAAKEANSLNRTDVRTIATYLRALYAGRCYRQMVDLVDVIVKASQENLQNPLLTQVSHLLHTYASDH